MQGCWRRAVALGRVVPARRAIAASSAREGEKARNGRAWIVVSVKSLEKLILDVLLVVDHDSDLKNRCSTGRFRVIAIHILSLPGGSKSKKIYKKHVYVNAQSNT